MRYFLVNDNLITQEMLLNCDDRVETAMKTPDGTKTPFVFSGEYTPVVGVEISEEEFNLIFE